MLNNVQAVLFDMDGTIIDSMWMWHEIDLEFMTSHQIPIPDNLQKDIEGKNFLETAEYFKETFSLVESTAQIMQCWNDMAMDKYRHEVPLKPGFAEFLKNLKEKGFRTGIATANSRELAEACLSAHGILQDFDVIMTGNDGLKGKPAPDIYLACANAIDVLPSNCLVFEDILNGIEAGHRAGMSVCAVYDKDSADTDDQKREAAEYYIHDYTEIKDF